MPLTAAAELVRQRRHARPRFYYVLELSDPAPLTLRFSDEYEQTGGAFGEGGFGVLPFGAGEEWHNMVLSRGGLLEAMLFGAPEGQPATAELTLRNHILTTPIAGKTRLSDLIRTPLSGTGTYEFSRARVTVYEALDRAHGASDRVRLGSLYVEDVVQITDRALTLRLSDEQQLIEHRWQPTRITRALFPECDLDAVGKDIPIPFGTLTDVPCEPIVSGITDTLAADITATSPGNNGILAVSRVADWPTSGTLQIDQEQIKWAAKEATGLRLAATGARGANGTTAQAHKTGAACWEVRSGSSAYRYMVGENPVGGGFRIKSVTNIRVDGVLQPQATVTLNAATLVPGKSFVVINFPARPRIERQVTLANDDTIAVQTTSTRQVTRTATNVGVVLDTNNHAGSPFFTMTLPAVPDGTVVRVDRRVTLRFTEATGSFSGKTWKIGRGEPNFGPVLAQGTGTFPVGVWSFRWSTGTSYANEKIWISLPTFAGNPRLVAVIDDYSVEVETTIQTNKSGTVTLGGNSTADVVIGGQVTCDVEGVQDDAGGTISGTGNLLLENPADITRFALTQLYDVDGDLGSTWAAARSRFASLAYRWAFLLTSTTFSDLRRRLGENAGAALYLDGGVWEYRSLHLGDPGVLVPVDLTVDCRDEVHEDEPGVLARTPRHELRTLLTVYAGRDYRETGQLGEQYRSVQELPQGGEADQEPIPYDLVLDMVQDPATAAAVGLHWRDTWSRQRWTTSLTTWWNATGVPLYATVVLANHPVLSGHGGSGLAWRVTGRECRLGDQNPGRMRLTLVESNAGSLTAAALIALSATAELTTAIPLTGTATIALVPAAELTTEIALTGTASITLSATASALS